MVSASKLFLQALSLSLLLIISPFAFAQDSEQNVPQRIVSLSLCSDQLLLLLTDKNRIASLSYLIADPAYSYLSNEAGDIPLNRGQAEEILTFAPDLIISSQFSASATVNLLQRLDHDVVILGFPTTLEESYAQIRQVAALVAEPERGEALIAKMQNDIEQALAAVPLTEQGKTAVFYSTNGFSHGSATLRNNFLEQFELKNLAAEIGMVGSARLSLEAMIMAKPDYLLVSEANPHSFKLAHPLLQHRALQKTFQPENIITLSDTLFQCAGPSLVEAFSIMSKQLMQKGL